MLNPAINNPKSNGCEKENNEQPAKQFGILPKYYAIGTDMSLSRYCPMYIPGPPFTNMV